MNSTTSSSVWVPLLKGQRPNPQPQSWASISHPPPLCPAKAFIFLVLPIDSFRRLSGLSWLCLTLSHPGSAPLLWQPPHPQRAKVSATTVSTALLPFFWSSSTFLSTSRHPSSKHVLSIYSVTSARLCSWRWPLPPANPQPWATGAMSTKQSPWRTLLTNCESAMNTK